MYAGGGAAAASSGLTVQRIGSGNGSGSTLIALPTAPLQNGAIAFVAREGAAFELVTEPSAALAAAVDGITVVAPTAPVGNELWVRQAGTSRRFAYEAAWWVDAGAGDDDNDGITVGTPLASVGELCRRLSGLRIPQSVTVTLAAGDYSADALALELELPQGVSVLLQGAVTSEADSIAAILPTVPGAPITNAGAQRGTVTATAAEFTRLDRLRITSGPAVGAVTWVTRVVTPGAGGVCNVSDWGTMNPLTGTLVTEVSPGVGVGYVIDTLDTTLGAVDVQVRGQGRVVLADCRVRPAGTSTWAYRAVGDNGNGNGVLFYRCDVGAQATAFFLNCVCTLALCLVTSDRAGAGQAVFVGGSVSARMITWAGRDAVLAITVRDQAILNQASGACFAFATVVLYNGGVWDQIGSTGNDAHWVDGADTNAIDIDQGGTWWAHSTPNRLWGLDNAFPSTAIGVRNGTFRYNSNATPSIPGGATDLTLAGTSFAWAALPAGIDTAAAGAGAIAST